jgi:hypothetical protein
MDLPQPNADDFEALELAKRHGSIRAYYLALYGSGSKVLVDDSHNKKVVSWWEFLKDAKENQQLRRILLKLFPGVGVDCRELLNSNFMNGKLRFGIAIHPCFFNQFQELFGG